MSYHIEVENLPLPDLRNEIRSELALLGRMGFPPERLDRLVSATDYRRDILFAEQMQELEKDHGRPISEKEQGFLFTRYAKEYDGLSGENLTETLKYQYDIKTRESRLDRAPFPAFESFEYKSIFRAMYSLGVYIKELMRRVPDHAFLQETLQVVSTSPQQILQKSLETVQRQQKLDMPDEAKAAEINLTLVLLLQDLNKSRAHGDELEPGLFELLEKLRNELTELYDAQNFQDFHEKIAELLNSFSI